MALSGLFFIGGTDLTNWEQTDKHEVNREDVYEEWTDGNWTTHRVIARTRVSGTVVLSFPRAADYTAFLSLLNSARDASGYYNVKVYCSNTGTLEEIQAFLDVNGDTKWDVTTPRVHQTVTVGIVGR